MEEVVVPEPSPGRMPALVVQWEEPRWAQSMLRLSNTTNPLFREAEHLKRIRPSPSQQGSLQLLLEAGPCLRRRIGPSALLSRSEWTEASWWSTSVGRDFQAELKQHFKEFFDAVWREVRGDQADLTVFLVEVPDRCPRRDPDMWALHNLLWPFAMPKPTRRTPPTIDFSASCNRWMTSFILPLSRTLSEKGLLGIAAAVVDPTTQEVLATSDGLKTMRRDCLASCVPYGVPVLQQRKRLRSCHVLDHPVTYALKRLSETKRDAEGGKQPCTVKPYLANKLDLFVSHEPCVMCAMALVHSRVERVFFCFHNTANGGLGSCYAVHSIPSLNHHFRVFYCSDAAKSFSLDGQELLLGENV